MWVKAQSESSSIREPPGAALTGLAAGQGTRPLPLRGLSPLVNPAKPGQSNALLIQKLLPKPRAKGGGKTFWPLTGI